MTRTMISFVAPALLLASAAHAEWISHEFRDTWNGPGQTAQEYLNEVCQPSGLDGIQLLGIQKGHGSTYNLHLACRRDKASGVHYRVTMVEFPHGKIDAAMEKVMANPNARIGPFFFGKVDGPEGTDGFLLVEKLP